MFFTKVQRFCILYFQKNCFSPEHRHVLSYRAATLIIDERVVRQTIDVDYR